MFVLPRLTGQISFVSINAGSLARCVLTISHGGAQITGVCSDLRPTVLQTLTVVTQRTRVRKVSLHLYNRVTNSPVYITVLVKLKCHRLSVGKHSMTQMGCLLQHVSCTRTRGLTRHDLRTRLTARIHRRITTFVRHHNVNKLVHKKL